VTAHTKQAVKEFLRKGADHAQLELVTAAGVGRRTEIGSGGAPTHVRTFTPDGAVDIPRGDGA
jgi:hypothetical protein